MNPTMEWVFLSRCIILGQWFITTCEKKRHCHLYGIPELTSGSDMATCNEQNCRYANDAGINTAIRIQAATVEYAACCLIKL